MKAATYQFKVVCLFLGLSLPSMQGSQAANQRFVSQPGNPRNGSWERGNRWRNPESAIAVHVGRGGGSVGTLCSSRDDQNVWETLVGLLHLSEELRKRRAAKPGAARLRSGPASAGRVLAGHRAQPEAAAAAAAAQGRKKSCG